MELSKLCRTRTVATIVEGTRGKSLIERKSKPKVQAGQRHNRLRRRVSFDETRNVWHEEPVWTTTDMQEQWYSKKEIQRMRDDKKAAYKSINADTSDAYKEALLRVYETCLQAQPNKKKGRLPKDAKKELKRVFREQRDRVGLERFCVADVADGHRTRRHSLVHEVVELHAQQTRNTPLTPLEQAEILRRSCEFISLPSRLFAYHTAVASQKRSSFTMKRRSSC